jgi:gamma-glutamylcyclotransferase
VECRTYQYSNKNRQRNAPSPHYKKVIVEGAIEHKLPDWYIYQLNAIEDNGYKGKVNVSLDVLRELNGEDTSTTVFSV